MRTATGRAASVAAAALLAGAALPAGAATRAVRVGSYYFEDARTGDSQVVVTQGDRITFTFEGKAQHTATVDGWFTSGTRSPGQRYTTGPLSRVGTFTLYCQVHGAPRHGAALVVRRRPAPSPSPSKPRSLAPSPKASPREPSPSPTPRRSASPTPSPARATSSPSPTSSPTSSPTPSPTTASPTPAVAASAASDVLPAGPLESDPVDWQLWAGLLGLLALAAGAIAGNRRRRA